MPTLLQAEGHAEGISLSALASTTPAIDGIMEESEWSDAATSHFFKTDFYGENPINGTIYVMNDYKNLYIVVKMSDTALDGRIVDIFFDNNHNGVMDVIYDKTEMLVESEDVLDTSVGISKTDWYMYPLKQDRFVYSFTYAADPKGSKDGSAGWTSDGIFNYYEFSHPLCSLDTMHDFCLSEGDTVGFNLNYVRNGIGITWPTNFKDSPFDDPLGYGDIIVAYSLSPDKVNVRIDLKPTSDTNKLNCNIQKGKISVGIFTHDGFDAQSVDVSTVQLDGIPVTTYKLKDLDADGDLDGLARFNKADVCALGIVFSADQSTDVTLTGLTSDGRQFEGKDTIVIARR